jgi:hypothetical protein
MVGMGSIVSGCAMKLSQPSVFYCVPAWLFTNFVMRSSMDRGSRMKVGSVTRLRSAPGRNCDMICMSTVVQVSCFFPLFRAFQTYCSPGLRP